MKRYKFIFCLSLLAIASCTPKPVEPPKPAQPIAAKPARKSVTAQELNQKIQNKEDFTLVDVRDEEEYVEGHIEGAKLIPCMSLRERYNEIDSQKEVVVYCHSGNRSQTAVSTLIFYEFPRITELRGGILEWEQKKYPVVKGLPQNAK